MSFRRNSISKSGSKDVIDSDLMIDGVTYIGDIDLIFNLIFFLLHFISFGKSTHEFLNPSINELI